MDRSIKCWRLPLTLFLSISSTAAAPPPLPLVSSEENFADFENEIERVRESGFREVEAEEVEVSKDNLRFISGSLDQSELDLEEEEEIQETLKRQRRKEVEEREEMERQVKGCAEYVEEEEDIDDEVAGEERSREAKGFFIAE
jgi:DNA repair photolyase